MSAMLAVRRPVIRTLSDAAQGERILPGRPGALFTQETVFALLEAQKVAQEDSRELRVLPVTELSRSPDGTPASPGLMEIVKRLEWADPAREYDYADLGFRAIYSRDSSMRRELLVLWARDLFEQTDLMSYAMSVAKMIGGVATPAFVAQLWKEQKISLEDQTSLAEIPELGGPDMWYGGKPTDNWLDHRWGWLLPA